MEGSDYYFRIRAIILGSGLNILAFGLFLLRVGATSLGFGRLFEGPDYFFISGAD